MSFLRLFFFFLVSAGAQVFFHHISLPCCISFLFYFTFPFLLFLLSFFNLLSFSLSLSPFSSFYNVLISLPSCRFLFTTSVLQSLLLSPYFSLPPSNVLPPFLSPVPPPALTHTLSSPQVVFTLTIIPTQAGHITALIASSLVCPTRALLTPSPSGPEDPSTTGKDSSSS